jgi:DNA polymerase-3 subunit alpha
VEDEVADFVSCVEAVFDAPHVKFDRSKPAAAVYVGRAADGAANPLRAWLEALGVMGKKATEKALPSCVYAMDTAELSQLLAGLWQGDGCIHAARGGQVYYATSSRELAEQVRHLLLRLGVLSTIHEKSFAYRGGHKVGFTVNLSGAENVRRFAETIGALLLPNKREKLDLILTGLDAAYDGTDGVIARGTKDVVPSVVLATIRAEMAMAGVTPGMFSDRVGIAKRTLGADSRRIGYTRPTLKRIAQGIGMKSFPSKRQGRR